MTKKITIVIPLDPAKEIDPYKELNIDKKKIEAIIVKGKNPSENRNNGVKSVKTPLIAFINGHTRLSDSWIKNVEKFFNETKADIVGGPQFGFKNDGIFSIASDFAFSSIFGAAGVRARYKPKKMHFDADENEITSANLICKKEVFKKIKFDESIYPGEDPKFISDAKKSGFSVAYSPDIIVYNKRRENLISLSKQIFSYGKTRPQKESFWETLKKPFFVVPSLFVFYLIFLPTLLLINWIFLIPGLVYMLMLALYCLFGGFKTRNILTIFVLLLIYPTIHLSYGLGFIFGTLKECLKARKNTFQ